MSHFIQDVRFALRTFRKNPGFTFAALITLALGIGANTAIFTVIDGVLLNPIPFPDSDRLVAIHQSGLRSDRNAVSYPNLLDWRRLTQTFEAIAAWRNEIFTLRIGGQPEQAIGMMVTADFFSVLRVDPLLGRAFTDREDERGGERVVLLGEDFWRRRFGADRSLVGKAITLNGRDHIVIGIVPSRVRLSRDQTSFFNDVFLPIGQFDDPFFLRRGTGFGIVGLGRLKPGVTMAQARTEMDGIMQNLEAQYPDSNDGVGASLFDFRKYVAGDLQPTLLALAAAVGFVLLIACTNVANLALAHSTSRWREFGVRLALGARKSRLMQQLFTESALIAIGGGGVGVLIASWGTDAALAILPSALPAISRVEINSRVLLFSVAISIMAALLFGLLPALKAAGVSLNDTLKQGGRGTIKTTYRAQHVLIVAEVALTLMLLVGAGLMIRSLDRLWNVNPGFDPEGVLTFYTGISPERASTPEKTRAAFLEISDRLAAIPGVESASVEVGGLPFRGNSTTSFLTDNDPESVAQRDMRTANFYAVAPAHFKTMGIPLLRGRSFTHQDSGDSPLVIVIDEQLAREAFVGQDPVGKHIRIDFYGRPLEIIGIVGHVKQSTLAPMDSTDTERAQFYTAVAQLPETILPLAVNAVAGIVKMNSASASLLPAIKKELSALDNGRAVHSEQFMTVAIAASLSGRRFSLIVLGVFAVTALILSIVGVYSVVSYSVGQRTSEIGLRMALGAQSRDVFWDVITEGGKLGLIGLAFGIAGAVALTRLMSGLLFGISPTDVLTFGSAAVLLFVLTLLACYIPARRAVHVDPMTALRCE